MSNITKCKCGQSRHRFRINNTTLLICDGCWLESEECVCTGEDPYSDPDNQFLYELGVNRADRIRLIGRS